MSTQLAADFIRYLSANGTAQDKHAAPFSSTIPYFGLQGNQARIENPDFQFTRTLDSIFENFCSRNSQSNGQEQMDAFVKYFEKQLRNLKSRIETQSEAPWIAVSKLAKDEDLFMAFLSHGKDKQVNSTFDKIDRDAVSWPVPFKFSSFLHLLNKADWLPLTPSKLSSVYTTTHSCCICGCLYVPFNRQLCPMASGIRIPIGEIYPNAERPFVYSYHTDEVEVAEVVLLLTGATVHPLYPLRMAAKNLKSLVATRPHAFLEMFPSLAVGGLTQSRGPAFAWHLREYDWHVDINSHESFKKSKSSVTFPADISSKVIGQNINLEILFEKSVGDYAELDTNWGQRKVINSTNVQSNDLNPAEFFIPLVIVQRLWLLDNQI